MSINTLKECRKRMRRKKKRSLNISQRCNLQCPERVVEEKQKELFDKYWKLHNIDLQQAYIRSCITIIPYKFRYPKNMQRQSFHFIINGHKVRVCKKFFISTLDISDKTINSVFEKIDKPTGLEKDFVCTCKMVRN